ncbi:MAG: hypothetical protein J6L75_01600 [Alistipes sp.]|nr:hypothetical protein [Alistipes sp.]
MRRIGYILVFALSFVLMTSCATHRKLLKKPQQIGVWVLDSDSLPIRNYAGAVWLGSPINKIVHGWSSGYGVVNGVAKGGAYPIAVFTQFKMRKCDYIVVEAPGYFSDTIPFGEITGGHIRVFLQRDPNSEIPERRYEL